MTPTRMLIVAHIIFLPLWALACWVLAGINSDGGSWTFWTGMGLGWVALFALAWRISRTQLLITVGICAVTTFIFLIGAALPAKLNESLGLLVATLCSPTLAIPLVTIGHIITLIAAARARSDIATPAA